MVVQTPAGQVEVNGSTGTFLADLVISGGVVTGLEILDHGSSYLNSPTTYYLEVTMLISVLI